MYHDAQGSRRAGIPPLVESWAPIRSIQAIERLALSLVGRYQDRRRRLAAIRDLRRMDDHVLQDLGIERGRIAEIASAQVAASRR